MKTALAALSAAACGRAFAAAAHAQDVKRSYADLDLSTSAGAQTFSQRLDTAAKAYCTGGPVYDTTSKARCMTGAREMFIGSLPTAKRTAFETALKGGATMQASTSATPPAGS